MEVVNSRKKEDDKFHAIHKIPYGDGPYVRAKYIQLVERDQEGAIVWFWKAINEGNRVESALKDMAIILKKLDRTEEAIEAIKSFRCRCLKSAQESLDNVLIDLYKKCGKVDEQIELLKQKLRMIYKGEAFNGKPIRTARINGKKFEVSISHETSRILGDLGCAYMKKSNFIAAELVYKKALMIDPDSNKACNLGRCLMKQARYNEACSVLQHVVNGEIRGSHDIRVRNRARKLIMETEIWRPTADLLPGLPGLDLNDEFVNWVGKLTNVWPVNRSKRLPIFEQIITDNLYTK